MSDPLAPNLTTYKLVFPEHLNQYGFLYGGNLLKWVDETAWVAARLDYPGANFVTVALDRVVFHKGAKDGDILRFNIFHERTGTTSITYRVDVTRRNLDTANEEDIFTTKITFVRVDQDGKKLKLT